ncbi:hypothetical protein POM88_021244 [Heracleum sosnowskyi]|uniref:non-specific serine/threonine protein kinase n=1 Tax=Heracleum sosnowskyi TaxID=360622 RepID=A0AAD8MSP7_9APIA|nr:hypothetical protein POM88_021244 [Heracleum sosnowskyi]
MVERRFEQYYHHLEEVVSSFEVIAGLGAGKAYTALALQAMSRHFCSLKDAIIYQISVARRKHLPCQDATRRAHLDWKRRLIIINGIAWVILYLHEDSRLRIIQRDLKASNILLDHDMNPKISDFGMARIFVSSLKLIQIVLVFNFLIRSSEN